MSELFDAEAIEAITRRWMARVVVGMNLCPFAKAVMAKDQVRIVVSDASTEDALLHTLGEELLLLRDTAATEVDTTLIVHPFVLTDFFDYNDFLARADDLLDAMALTGDIQVASFHPDYQFAETALDDASNNTNRAPFPILHLLREDSVTRAVAAYPEPDSIIDRNIATMNALGNDGFNALMDEIKNDDASN